MNKQKKEKTIAMICPSCGSRTYSDINYIDRRYCVCGDKMKKINHYWIRKFGLNKVAK